MRFLADESCDFRIVRALRSAGHDVLPVVDVLLGATDAAVIDLAIREDRIFLTEDRDFGQLVYAAVKPARGVILIRFPSVPRTKLPQIVVEIVSQHAERLIGGFTVVQPGRVRFGTIPRE